LSIIHYQLPTTLIIKEENIRLIFGLKLKQLRVEKNLSLLEVSKASGISVSYLNEIEKGKKYPKANKIAQMAKAFDVSYDWMVSMQLTKNLSPIAELIKSDLLTNLPLEIFGIGPADLMDLISNTPSKISAFISTLIEIARNYNIGVENFYFSVLRSYQEMHENYFDDLEDIVDKFVKEYPDCNQSPLSSEVLISILQNTYHYQIEEQDFEAYPELKLEDIRRF
jgi:transcriptional regulator with XRE-family HTH domain